MSKYRMLFEKKDSAVYLSHLDLMKLIQRAFFRSDINLMYSEGFNPHPKISAVLPLPLGCGSCCELLDFQSSDELNEQNFIDKINASFPAGIRVISLYSPERKGLEVKYCSYKLLFRYYSERLEEIKDELEQFYSAESIMIEKKSKRSSSVINLADYITVNDFGIEGNFIFGNFTVCAQEPTINPSLLVSALSDLSFKYIPDFVVPFRTEVFDSFLNVFR